MEDGGALRLGEAKYQLFSPEHTCPCFSRYVVENKQRKRERKMNEGREKEYQQGRREWKMSKGRENGK